MTPKKQENSSNSRNNHSSNNKKDSVDGVDEDNEYEPSIESSIKSDDCKETVTLDV